MKIAMALGGQTPEHLEQRLDLGRRQHGRRLVQDEQLGASVERLQDLEPLAHPQVHVLNLGVQVDLQPVLLGQRPDSLRGPLQVEPDPAFRAHPQDDVLQGGELAPA
jgi:hypothetical protein